MARFDGPAGGTQPNKIPRDELEQAAHEFEDESGDDSESEPDHISSFPLNARGVDAKLVSSSKITKDHPRKSIIEFQIKRDFQIRRARLRANRCQGSLGPVINDSWINSWIGKGHDGGWFTEEYLESIRRAFYEHRNRNDWTDYRRDEENKDQSQETENQNQECV